MMKISFFPFKSFGSKYTDVELYKCVDVLFSLIIT